MHQGGLPVFLPWGSWSSCGATGRTECGAGKSKGPVGPAGGQCLAQTLCFFVRGGAGGPVAQQSPWVSSAGVKLL